MLAAVNFVNKVICNYAAYAVSVITLLAGIALIVYRIVHLKRNGGYDKDSAFAGMWWTAVFVFGFALYLIAYLQADGSNGQTAWNFALAAVIRSITSAICLFCFVFDYNALAISSAGNTLYLLAISVCFIAGSLWTLSLAQKLFLKGITNGFSIWLNALIPGRKKNTRYVVIGCGETARVIVKNLTSGKNSVPKRRVTLITGAQPAESGQASAYFKEYVDRGFKVINGDSDKFNLLKAGVRVDRNVCVLSVCDNDVNNVAAAELISTIIFNRIFEGSKYKDSASDPVFGRKLIAAREFGSNSEKTVKTEEDKELSDIYSLVEKASRNVLLCARIKYDYKENTEHFVFTRNALGKVDFFSPYEIRAREFFKTHPITSFIRESIDTDRGRLKGELKDDGIIYKEDGNPYAVKNVFVGFGKTNYQLLRWSIMTGQLQGCGYHADVYDNDTERDGAADRWEIFKNRASGLFPGRTSNVPGDYLPDPNEKINIGYYTENVLSDAFACKLAREALANDFTGVYISLGDDKVTVETALEIRQKLYECGVPSQKVGLFAAVKRSSAINSEYVLNNALNNVIRIEVFGSIEDTLTTKNIDDREFDDLVRHISNKRGMKWELLSWTEREINRQVALHVNVKLNLIGLALADDTDKSAAVGEEEYRRRYGTDDPTVKKIISDKDKLRYLVSERDLGISDSDAVADSPRNNLAILEHLRWNVFYLVNGWTKKPLDFVGSGHADNPYDKGVGFGRKNELTKQHACITNFDGLVRLRKLQARKSLEAEGVQTPSDEELLAAEKKCDTISYDFTAMDGLFGNLPADKKIISLN